RHRRGFGAERAWLRAGPRCGRRRGALRVPGDRYLLSTQPERDGRCRAGAGAAAGAARADGLRVVITLGAAFGCPFEGCVAPARMLDLAAQVQRATPDEIVLADTMGVGVPRQVRELVAGVRALAAVAGCHFHNTRNTGFTNALAAVEAGA